jgi:hypothetical protein
MAVISAIAFAACDDATGLDPAFFENTVDTLTLYALQGTAIADPSAFDVVIGETVRIERGEAFDFVFDIDSAGNPILYPTQALGFADVSGIAFPEDSWSDLREAPTDGYETENPVALAPDTLFVVRSRASAINCSTALGALPRYGKFRVLALDFDARTATLEALVNLNCGYRGLEPGYPDR